MTVYSLQKTFSRHCIPVHCQLLTACPVRQLRCPSGYTVSMLSVFPEVLFLAPFSASIIRVALGGVFAYAAWMHMKSTDRLTRVLSVVESAMVIFLIAGAWTQLAALGALLIIIVHFLIPRLRTVSLSTALLSLVMCVSLLVTGAGALAFDLPL